MGIAGLCSTFPRRKLANSKLLIARSLRCCCFLLWAIPRLLLHSCLLPFHGGNLKQKGSERQGESSREEEEEEREGKGIASDNLKHLSFSTEAMEEEAHKSTKRDLRSAVAKKELSYSSFGPGKGLKVSGAVCAHCTEQYFDSKILKSALHVARHPS